MTSPGDARKIMQGCDLTADCPAAEHASDCWRGHIASFPLPTDEDREALANMPTHVALDGKRFGRLGETTADYYIERGFRRSVVSTPELADALDRECQSLPNWPGRTHDMVKIEWFAKGVVDSAAFIRDHAVSAPLTITDADARLHPLYEGCRSSEARTAFLVGWRAARATMIAALGGEEKPDA